MRQNSSHLGGETSTLNDLGETSSRLTYSGPSHVTNMDLTRGVSLVSLRLIAPRETRLTSHTPIRSIGVRRALRPWLDEALSTMPSGILGYMDMDTEEWIVVLIGVGLVVLVFALVAGLM